MPNALLTIENFEFEKLRAKTPESKKSGNVRERSLFMTGVGAEEKMVG